MKKRRMLKKIMSILLCVAMCVSMIPTSIVAADGDVASVTIGSVTTYYTTLQEAVDAVPVGESGTVKLLADVDEIFTIRGEGITLELGSFTISSPITVEEGASAIIKGGTMNNMGDGTVLIRNYGSLVLDGLTLLSDYNCAVNYGEIVIKGGTFTSAYESVIWQNEGTLTIEGMPEYESYVESGSDNIGIYWYGGTIDISGCTDDCSGLKLYAGSEDFKVSDIKLSADYSLYQRNPESGVQDVISTNTIGWGEVEIGSHKHVYNSYEYDEDEHWVACHCGLADGDAVKEAHSYDIELYNDSEHWDECECGYEKTGSRRNHKEPEAYDTDGTYHWKQCEDCQYIIVDKEIHYDDDGVDGCDVCGGSITYLASITRDGVETKYFTLQNAVNSVAEDEEVTIELLGDTVEGIDIYVGKITLDLNGHTITAEDDEEAVHINDGADIIIKDGTVFDSQDLAISVRESAALNLDNVTVDSETAGMEIIRVGGTLSINDSTINGNIAVYGWSEDQYGNMVECGSLTIKGDTAINVDLDDEYVYSIELWSGSIDLSGMAADDCRGWKIHVLGDYYYPNFGTVMPLSNISLPGDLKLLDEDGVEVTESLSEDVILTVGVHEHNYTSVDYDENHHWEACACGDVVEGTVKEEHIFEDTNYDEENHWIECECGARSEEAAHSFSEQDWDDEGHWNYCECGASIAKESHVDDDADKSCDICEAEVVMAVKMSINGGASKEYISIQDAFDELTDTDSAVITLLRDVNQEGNALAGTITLDLNGYTLSYEDTPLNIYNEAIVTIKNGIIISEYYSAVYVDEDAEAIIKKDVELISKGDHYAIDSSGTLTIEGATLTAVSSEWGVLAAYMGKVNIIGAPVMNIAEDAMCHIDWWQDCILDMSDALGSEYTIYCNGDIPVTKLVYDEELYAVDATYTDDTESVFAGNDVITLALKDVNAPTAEYQIGTNGWKQLVNFVSFGIFCKDYATLEIQAEDDISGVAMIEYFIWQEEVDDVSVIGDWQEYTEKVDLIPENTNYIYVRVTDNAGNVAIYSDGVVVYSESVVNDTQLIATYKAGEDVTAKVEFNGNTVDEVTAALDSEAAVLSVSIDGDALTEGTDYEVSDTGITFKAEWLDSLDVGQYTINVEFNPAGVETTEVTLTDEIVLTVEPKELKIIDIEAEDKVYDGTSSVKVNNVKLDGINGTDDVKIDMSSLKGDALGADAGKSPAVMLSGVSLTGSDAANYEIKVIDGTSFAVSRPVEISPKPITGADATLGAALTYNGSEQTQTVSSVKIDGMDVTFDISGNKATNVGTYELTITGNGNFTDSVKVKYTVAPDVSDIEDLTTDNVKISDKAAIEKVVEMIEEAEDTLADETTKAQWNEILEKCTELLNKIKALEEAEEPESPKTGDSGNAALWLAIAFVSIGGLCGIIFTKKKSTEN